MRKIFTLLMTSLFVSSVLFAQLNTRIMQWGELDREYMEYVSPMYDGSEPVPVIFCLHGLGDTMTNFYGVGFNHIVDTANGIVIVPQAILATYMGYEIGTAWNSGAGMYGIFPNADIDDTGLLMAILDSLENNFNIDTDRVYFMGFSMGGFMCNRLAAEVGDRIEAIASVSGTIGDGFTPEPTVPVNALHFHGTADSQVAYTENTAGMDAEDLVDFWVNYDNCDVNPIYYQYPDIKDDGLTFERFIYRNGDEESTVAFVKINGGDHEWYYTPVNDIDYTKEIWRFFNNKFTVTTDINGEEGIQELQLYPNPASDYVIITNNKSIDKIGVYNLVGSKVMEKQVNKSTTKLDVSELNSGLYVIRVYTGESYSDRKLIVK